MIYFRHVKQTSLDLKFTMVDPQKDPLPVDLTGTTITSQIRSEDGTFSVGLAVKITDPGNGAFTVSATVNSQADWPIGELFGRVRISNLSGKTLASEPFKIVVEPPLTKV